MTKYLDLFTHVFIDNQSDQTLCLLHGTGADEYDLIPVAQIVAPKYNYLSLRGNVKEQGMNRFFKRYKPGVFDQASIETETTKLAEFLQGWNQAYSHQFTYLGYSNGANMILATGLRFPKLFHRLVIMHGMLPFQPPQIDLSHWQVLVTIGLRDQLIPASDSQTMKRTLLDLGAEVESVELSGGHELSQLELEAVKKFLADT